MPGVYLDSCVIIYLIEGPPALHEAIASALRPTDGAAPDVFISDLTRLECRVAPLRDRDEESLSRYDAFFALQEVTRIPMTAEVFDIATSLRASHRLKTPDALHLAAAILGGCEELWTNDDHLVTAAKSHVAVRILPQGDIQ